MHCSKANKPKILKIQQYFSVYLAQVRPHCTDQERPLIGDDEHGWSDNGIFNFEGGCYVND